MSTDDLLIHEFAKLTGVSTRTIRFYTQEGLLPEPIIQGKYAIYGERHIQRLRLILQLKDAYLPLKEIRQLMDSLTDQDVQDMLANKNQLDLPSRQLPIQAEPKVTDSALNYIANLLQTQSDVRKTETPAQPPSMPRPSQPIQRLYGAPTQTWQRIDLAPGVELHIKEPLDPKYRSRFDELVHYAKKLFKS